jgi:hypothetical protein
MDKLPDDRHLTLRRWRLKATRPLVAAGRWVAEAAPSFDDSDDERPLIPADRIKSSYVEDPENEGVGGERVGQGVHAIPRGREVRLAYEVDPDAGTFDVRRRAYYDGDELSEVQVETLAYDPETNVVRSPFRDIPDTDPEDFAEAHFARRPGAELVDGFSQCLPKWERPRDYPLDPKRR